MSKSDSTGLRFPLLDIGYPPGEEFCRALLQIGDFNAGTLQHFTKARGEKADLARALAADITDSTKKVDVDGLMFEFCKQPRQWLALYLGEPGDSFAGESAKAFLTQFGSKSAFYGPFVEDPFADTVEQEFYVCAERVDHWYDAGGGNPVNLSVRWHVVLEVGDTYLAAHWNNFDSAETSDDDRIMKTQFPYWRHVPAIVQKLENLRRGATWELPDLHTVVLKTMLETYSRDKNFVWTHERIRAERDGIALSAAGSKMRDLDIHGVETLTRALAKSALSFNKIPTPADVLQKTSNALLRTLLHEWGTKSYQFSLEKSGDEGEKVFRGHCYFGAKESDKGPDSLPHVKTFAKYGASVGARNFILQHLNDS